MNIVIATIKSWNIANAKAFMQKHEGTLNVHLITDKEELTYDALCKIQPSYIFFPHWSWIIPEKIFSQFECIVFHMTDLPYGRGGSPLQNLILNKRYQTKISAIRVCQEVDAGDVFFKEDFTVEHGSADDILRNLSSIVFSTMITKVLSGKYKPCAQQGEVTHFVRRKPEQSDILAATLSSDHDIYDFVRMLDGEGYPRAFIPMPDGKKIVLKNSQLVNGKVVGEFEIE